jgi:hypothetical protein
MRVQYPDKMDFGAALAALKLGRRVARSGWNGKGMRIELVKGDSSALRYARLPYIQVFTADEMIVPWLASQTDLLANDWEEVT